MEQHVHTKYCPKAKHCEKLKSLQRELDRAKRKINELLEEKKSRAAEGKNPGKDSAAA